MVRMMVSVVAVAAGVASARAAGGDEPAAAATGGSMLTINPGEALQPPDTGPAKAPPMAERSAWPDWTVQVEPSAWYVAPSGKLKLPVGSGTGPGGFTSAGDKVRLSRLNIDSPRFEPSGEVHLSADRWRLSFSGSAFSIERNNTPADAAFRLGSVAVSPGDPLDVKMDFTTVELTAGYCAWGRLFSGPKWTQRTENATDALARLYIIAGARFEDVSFDVRRDTAVAASASYDEFFAEPIAGIRLELELAEAFMVDAQLTAGGLPTGDKSSYSVDIIAGFQWRPIPNLGIQIGYRQLAVGLSDGEGRDEFEYDGRLAGLMGGIVIRF